MIEYAMTAWTASDGPRRCDRPAELRETADRLRRWAGGGHETCQSCSALPATRVVADVALCGRCGPTRDGLSDLGIRRRRAVAPVTDAERPQFRGMAIVFDQPSEDLGFREFIRRSAVDRNEAEGVDVRALWNHDMTVTLGRISAGTLRTRVTPDGVAVEIDPPRWAAAHVESVARRDITGMSFAFETITDAWRLEDGDPVREVTDMRYHEVSPVSFPAYPATTLTVVNENARAAWLREQQRAERLRLLRV